MLFQPPPSSGSSSPLNAKGDIYTFSTVDARLAVGSNGTVLTADSTQTTGVKWAANTPLSLSAIYSISAGGTSNSTTPINFDTLIYDSSSAVTTGANWKFTVPTNFGGVYSIQVGVQINSLQDVNIYKNGTFTTYSILTVDTTNTWGFGSFSLPLVAGDFIDIRVGGPGGSYSNVNRTHIAITRVAN